jgi:drug/metabolite transporter superfamily protein YnfA
VSKIRIVREYFQFLRQQKKWWLLPIAVLLVVFGAIIVLTQGSALAPFIYALY